MNDKLLSIDELQVIAAAGIGQSMLLAKQLLNVMRENEDFREALKMIAKPALGGKTQQSAAQQALRRSRWSGIKTLF